MAVEIPTLPLEHGGAIPQLGLGTWRVSGSGGADTVAEALDLGYRHIDTAEMYDNEAAIGRAIAGVDRSELFLTSKVWPNHLRSGNVVEACEGSLRRLGTDYLDLYLIHWPNPEVPVAETVAAMESLRADGRIRSWGVSNFTIELLEEVLEHGRPSNNQVELHPRLQELELVGYCQDTGITVTGYSPLAKGRAATDETLARIGERYGRSAAQVALRWSVQRGCVVIPKASDPDHLASNLEIFDFELDTDEMDRIAALDRGQRLVETAWTPFGD